MFAAKDRVELVACHLFGTVQKSEVREGGVSWYFVHDDTGMVAWYRQDEVKEIMGATPAPLNGRTQ